MFLHLHLLMFLHLHLLMFLNLHLLMFLHLNLRIFLHLHLNLPILLAVYYLQQRVQTTEPILAPRIFHQCKAQMAGITAITADLTSSSSPIMAAVFILAAIIHGCIALLQMA